MTSLTGDPSAYVTGLLRSVSCNNVLSMEAQINIVRIICEGDLSISNETREQACFVLTSAIQNNQEMSNNMILFLNAFNPTNYLPQTIFRNLHPLLEETSNVQIQNWVLWAFAVRVKYGIPSDIQQTQMKLLEEYLSYPEVSWSISYIIRKMTERYDEQVSENIWYLLTKIINSNEYDVGTYINAFGTLGNFFTSKYTDEMSAECRRCVVCSIENVIITGKISQDICSSAAVEAFKCMVMYGHTISEEISQKVKELAQGDYHYLNENMKTILDLLNDAKNERDKIDIPKRHYRPVRIEKIAATKTIVFEQSQEKTVEPQSKFTDLEVLMDTYGDCMNSNGCDVDIECQPYIPMTGDHLSVFRNTVQEVQHLLKLVEQGKYLTEKDIKYLLKKCSDGKLHYFSNLQRNEVYILIASTFRQSIMNGQQQSSAVLKLLSHRLTDPAASLPLVRKCSETFLELVKHNQIIPDDIVGHLVDLLLVKTNDSIVRKTILDILAIKIEKETYDMNISLEAFENDLLQRTTCLPVSYLFLRTVLTEQAEVSSKALRNLCHVAVSQNKKVFHIAARRNCMAVIAHSIKTMNNRPSLFPTIQFCLMKAFEDNDDNIRLLALKTLCSYSEVECITHFHPRVLNDIVYRILINEINNQASQQLQHITLLYLKAARKKQLLLSEVLITISDLLGSSPDFDVRHNAIWTLKYTAEALNTIVLPPAALVNVEIALDDPEFPIRFAAANIFLNNWQKSPVYLFKKSQTSIPKLLTNKFDTNVHKHTLSILKEIVEQNHELSNDLIELIALFLLDQDMTIVAITADILLNYVRYYSLSQNIVAIVEGTFRNRSNQKILIQVLRKCTFNQSILMEDTLITLSDLLFENIEEITRNNILSTLEFADRNQSLPKSINDTLKYEYYIKVLSNSKCAKELEYAEQQLIDGTSNGKQLSKSSLQQLLSNPERQTSILKIIFNVTSNGQNLNNEMMNILSDLMSKETNQVYLIKIFLKIIVNNQIPPDTFLVHLQEFIDVTMVNTDVLLIYTILLERNANGLSLDVINRIYQLLKSLSELNLELKQNLSNFVKLAIESGIEPPEPEFLTALLNEKDPLIQSNTLQMIHYMIKTRGCILSDSMLTHLYQMNMDKNVLEIFESVRQTQPLPPNIIEMLEIVHYKNFHEDINQLEKLKLAVSHGQLLLKHHFPELSSMLYSANKEHRILASEILAASNQTLPDQVIEAIVATLRDESIYPNTLQLLKKVLQCGWKISERTIADLIDLVTQSSTNVEVKEIVREILQKENVADFQDIEQYLCNIDTSENSQVEKLIENHEIKIPLDKLSQLYNILIKQPSTSTEVRILKVLQCAVYNKQIISDELLYCISTGLTKNNKEIVAVILSKAIDNGQTLSEDVIHTIEDSFSVNDTKSILNLIRKLAEQSTTFRNTTNELLINKTKTDPDALSVLEIIAEYQQLPLDILRPHLNENFLSGNKSAICSSFVILQYQMLNNYISEPFEFLTKLSLAQIVDQNKLITQISSIDEYLSTVRSLLSIDHFEPTIFEIYPVKQWSRECLCNDLLTRMGIMDSPTEIYAFYHNLSKLEESNGYELYDDERDYILQLLIQKHAEMDINTINQILLLLQDVSINMLKSNDSNWYRNLVKYSIRQQVIKHFPQSKYSQSVINYSTDLLSDVHKNYQSIEMITSILHSYSEPDQLITFLHQLSDHKVTKEELNQILLLSHKTKTKLNKQLEMKIINKRIIQIWNDPQKHLKEIDELLRKISVRWEFPNLSSMLNHMQEKSVTSEQFIQCLILINNYQIDDTICQKILPFFSIQPSEKCFDELYKFVINHRFPQSHTNEKSIQQLIEETFEDNQSVLTCINKNKLQETIRLLSTQKIVSIENWTKDHIKQWSTEIQSNAEWAKRPENLSEILAVIQHAVYLHSNYKVRHVQLMAVLLLLDSKENRGRLAQIATGEGKSTIISMLAIIKALQGLKVDIVTSSTTLAQRDAKEKAELYDMFNLSVSHNSDDNNIYKSGPKQCYKSSIVYGDASHFQFDILRDEFSLLETRAKRSFDVVIIDEVDSMLIDENNKIARLADYILGMEYLNPVLNAIWQAIKNPAIAETFDSHTIIHNIKSLILDKNPQFVIPRHLRSFVFSQLSLWIKNALLARDVYKLDHHYLIKSDEQNIHRITPIDYLNTGVIQSSTSWSDGLHQFLQLKHRLKLTPLNLTTNFLSNITFFNRYKDKIYGLTGTLGSEAAKHLLCKVYSVDTIILPKYKQLCHAELPSIIVNGKNEWIQAIVQSSLREVQRHRSVLIICETRVDAKTIFKELRQEYFNGHVKLYTDNTDIKESNVVDRRTNSGEIIVATNLAGRGTDLKTSKEVEDNGGLHVCLTFMPINLRVKQQAFGRTSRQGNRGTSQLILNVENVIPHLSFIYPNFIKEHPDLPIDDLQTIEYLGDWCQKAETAQLDQIRKTDIPQIELKDELFRNFCQLLAVLRQIDNDEYKLNSVKEQWGLWLKNRDDRERIKISLNETVKMTGFQFINDRPTSFYRAVSKQLQKNISDEELKNQMIKHILLNQTYYEDFLNNLDNEISILYIEETMIKALIRTFNINILLFNSNEEIPTLYKRKNADRTIYLAREIDLSYYALGVIHEENIPNDVPTFEDEYELPAEFNTRESPIDGQLYEKLRSAFEQQDALIEYCQFEQQIREQYQKEDKIIQNPFYHIARADMLIAKSHTFLTRTKQIVRQIASVGTLKSTERQKALQCLNAAIQLDPIYSFTAYVYRAYLSIEEKPDEYKENALADLINARDQIKNFIVPMFHSMQSNLYDNNNNDHLDCDDLSKQLITKINIIQSYNDHIEQAILTIESSQKLIDITISDKTHITTKTKLERHQALKLIDSSDTNRYKLCFHNLSLHKDMGIPKDQGINLIDLMKPDYQNISLQFQQKTNKLITDIIKSYMEIVQHDNLHVDDLNKEELLKLLPVMIDNEIMMHVTITSKKREEYQTIIKESNAMVTINISLEKSMKFSTNMEALEYLHCNTDKKIMSISFTSVNVQFFEIFIDLSLDDAVFSLTFNKLSTTETLNVINTLDKPISIEFTNLNIKQASKMIKARTERDFLICLDELSPSKAQQILKTFNPNEQDVNVMLKPIDENYHKNDKPDDELTELAQHGINKLIIINELNPIPWFSVMSMVALGTAQIIGGVCLGIFSCGIGVTLGISLISEGVSDLYYALRGAISRDINWKDYAIQKGISLAVCFATLGVSVVAQSFRAAQQVGTKGAPQLVKQTWTGAKNLIGTSFKTIAVDSIETTAKNGVSLACKQVAIVTAETGAREVLNYSSDHILNDHLLVHIRSEIGNYIESSMDELIDKDLEYRKMLEKIFLIDSYNQNHQLQKQMEQIAFNILNTYNQYIDAAKSFANGTSNAVINHLGKTGNTTANVLKVAQKGLDIVKTIQKAFENTILTKKFFYAFKGELENVVKGMPDMVELLSKEQNIDRETAETIVLILKDHHIFNIDGSLNQDLFPEDENENIIELALANEQINDRRFSVQNLKLAIQKIDLNVGGHDYKSIVINFFIRILNDTYQKSILQQKIYKLLIDQLMSFIREVLIGPIKRYVIVKAVQMASQEIQRSLDTNHETVAEQLEYAGAQRYINKASNEFIKDVQSGKIKMESNAKEKLEKILQKPMKDRNDLEKMVLTVLENKGGGIIELGLISAMTGLKFSVMQDEESVNVLKNDGTIHLIYKDDKVTNGQHVCHDGYWKLVGGSDLVGMNRENSSLYDVICTQAPGTFASPAEIRTRVAEYMFTNPMYIQRILPAVNIINSNSNPIRRKALLMTDGRTQIDITQLEPKWMRFMKPNSTSPSVKFDVIRNLAKWINSISSEIILLIDVAQKLFPDLISREDANKGMQFVTLIKSGINVVENVQNKDVMGVIRELHSIGDIIFKFSTKRES